MGPAYPQRRPWYLNVWPAHRFGSNLIQIVKHGYAVEESHIVGQIGQQVPSAHMEGYCGAFQALHLPKGCVHLLLRPRLQLPQLQSQAQLSRKLPYFSPMQRCSAMPGMQGISYVDPVLNCIVCHALRTQAPVVMHVLVRTPCIKVAKCQLWPQ